MSRAGERLYGRVGAHDAIAEALARLAGEGPEAVAQALSRLGSPRPARRRSEPAVCTPLPVPSGVDSDVTLTVEWIA